MKQQHQKVVLRSFALPVPAFDHLKDFQRAYERHHGIRLTNSQVLTIILDQHKAQSREVGE